MFSMRCSSCLTPKPKFTDPITSDHLLISKTTKNDGRSKPSEITDDEAEMVINTKSYGKDTRSLRQRGNQPHVLKMGEKKFFENIDIAIISTQMNNEIYTFTLVNPEGRETLLMTTEYNWKKMYHDSAYPHPDLTPPTEEERAVVFSESYSPTPPSLYRRIKQKISAMF